jgi:hypothetical protein
MQATVEYEPIVKKLLEKSEQGRLNWVKAIPPEGAGWMVFKEPGARPIRPPALFTCTVEDEYKFESRRTEDGFELTMKDSEGDEVFSIAAEQAVLYDDPKKEELFNMLRDLYELARKKALNVDKKIATATGLLDKI